MRRRAYRTIIEGWSLFEEYRGAERRSGSSSRLMWWQQEMNLKEDDDGRIYGAAGNEVGADQGQRGGVLPPLLDPCERFMDRPNADAAPEDFIRRIDLGG